ncbi:MAG: hypothetical protein HZB16_21140 [Armatimonadetes bacterium]|nr:hypothetical protein [Armatimonadota bacterium]
MSDAQGTIATTYDDLGYPRTVISPYTGLLEGNRRRWGRSTLGRPAAPAHRRQQEPDLQLRLQRGRRRADQRQAGASRGSPSLGNPARLKTTAPSWTADGPSATGGLGVGRVGHR